jgi:hypothetical protein
MVAVGTSDMYYDFLHFSTFIFNTLSPYQVTSAEKYSLARINTLIIELYIVS